MQSFGTLGQLVKIPPFFTPKLHSGHYVLPATHKGTLLRTNITSTIEQIKKLEQSRSDPINEIRAIHDVI